MIYNNAKKLIVKVIPTKNIYAIRHPVLRKDKPLSSCIFDGDELETTFHIGGFINNKLVAVASILKNNNDIHKFKNAAQLRGMAVLYAYQGKGYGQVLLSYGENLLVEQKIALLWMNARIKAVNFYNKLDYTIISNVFEVPQVGKHYVMYKNLI